MAQVSTTKPSAPAAAAAGFGAHIADPAPLGLAGFALTTFMLSTFNAGLLPKTAEVSMLGVALFYGGIAQLFAGMWEFVKGNTFGALAFSSYGAFWMSLWYLIVHSGLAKADSAKGVGIFLLAWTIFTLYMTVVAARINRPRQLAPRTRDTHSIRQLIGARTHRAKVLNDCIDAVTLFYPQLGGASDLDVDARPRGHACYQRQLVDQ
jgi:hypothetical protein